MPALFAGSRAYPRPSPRPVLSIGNFDGVHHGHRHLLGALVERARSDGAPACVYTFEPPPRVVLAPHQHRPRILPWPEKVALLGEAGVEHVVIERFTRAFAQHPPEWFATQVLGKRIGPRAIVVGYDFRFGKARGGDVALLRRLLPTTDVVQIDAFAMDGRTVSSSGIREMVEKGDVAGAARLLGRPHRVRGTVVPGDRRGRAIGFPTANIETDAELLPARGVYAVRVRIDDGDAHAGVANLGLRPTFRPAAGVEGDSGTAPAERMLLEVHLLDLAQDVYGCELEVEFVHHLRDERRFPDVDALVAQIRTDVEAARELLTESRQR